MFYENLSEIGPFNDYNLHDADWHNVLKPIFELSESQNGRVPLKIQHYVCLFMITKIKYFLYTVWMRK